MPIGEIFKALSSKDYCQLFLYLSVVDRSIGQWSRSIGNMLALVEEAGSDPAIGCIALKIFSAWGVKKPSALVPVRVFAWFVRSSVRETWWSHWNWLFSLSSSFIGTVARWAQTSVDNLSYLRFSSHRSCSWGSAFEQCPKLWLGQASSL